MRGLLLQELYSMKQVGRMYGIVMLIYSVIGILNRSVSNFSAFLMLLSAMLVVNMFSYHEKSRWEMYAATMPVSRKQIVGSFYVVGGVAAGIAVTVGILMNLVDILFFAKRMEELVWITIGFCELSIFYIALFIPILIHFGPERGRIVLVLVYLVPFVLGYLFYTAVGISEELLRFLFGPGALGIGTVVLVIAFAVSYKISILLYRKKEF